MDQVEKKPTGGAALFRRALDSAIGPQNQRRRPKTGVDPSERKVNLTDSCADVLATRATTESIVPVIEKLPKSLLIVAKLASSGTEKELKSQERNTFVKAHVKQRTCVQQREDHLYSEGKLGPSNKTWACSSLDFLQKDEVRRVLSRIPNINTSFRFETCSDSGSSNHENIHTEQDQYRLPLTRDEIDRYKRSCDGLANEVDCLSPVIIERRADIAQEHRLPLTVDRLNSGYGKYSGSHTFDGYNSGFDVYTLPVSLDTPGLNFKTPETNPGSSSSSRYQDYAGGSSTSGYQSSLSDNDSNDRNFPEYAEDKINYTEEDKPSSRPIRGLITKEDKSGNWLNSKRSSLTQITHSMNNLRPTCKWNGNSLLTSRISRSESSGCKSCEETQERYEKAEVISSKKGQPLPTYWTSTLTTTKYKTGYIDAHCHLDFLFKRLNFKGTYQDYISENKSTFPDSYRGCIAVFCKPFTFSKKYMWQKYLSEDNVWGAFGCHPHEAGNYDDSIEGCLKMALKHPKVRALGEIGLDYSDRNNCSKRIQQRVLRRQLKIAVDRQLRLVIHCRDANEDCIAILQEFLPANYVFHLHCFTDSWKWAEKWMKSFPNVFIGLTNLVTYNTAKPTHEVARRIPLNRLLLETDAPYFVPRMSPRNTRHSHPGMALHVAAQIAALRDVSVDEVLQWTFRNTKFVYNI